MHPRSRVAVLMPAYNVGAFINLAVESLRQSRYACDLFIVDDGSVVPVAEVLHRSYRAQVIRLEKNGGVARALNAGLTTILQHPYEYIARFDADDICHPDRIALQVEFMDRHPDVAVVGTWGRFVEESSGNTLFIARPPETSELVKKAMRSNSAVIHPSAMFRASMLRAVGSYSESYSAAEDYEFFRRIATRFAIANIPRVLVDVRVSSQCVSSKRRQRQLLDRLRIQLLYLEPREVGAWTGLAKTIALFFAPIGLLAKLKWARERIFYSEAPSPANGPVL